MKSGKSGSPLVVIPLPSALVVRPVKHTCNANAMPSTPAPLVPLDLPVMPVLMENLVFPDPAEKPVKPALHTHCPLVPFPLAAVVAHLDPADPLETKVPLDNLATLDLAETLERLETPENLAAKVPLVTLETLDALVALDLRDLLATLEPVAEMANPDPRDLPDLQDKGEPLDLLATQETVDLLVELDPRDHPDPKDLLDLLEDPETLVLRLSLAKMPTTAHAPEEPKWPCQFGQKFDVQDTGLAASILPLVFYIRNSFS